LDEPGEYTVSLKVTDANGSGSDCVSTTATWNNVKPTVNSVTAANATPDENTTTTITAV
jgi:hypothetical protein